jgi:hypothetical protein
MFALSGKRTRDLLRSRRVFPPLRHIGRQKLVLYKSLTLLFPKSDSDTIDFTPGLILVPVLEGAKSLDFTPGLILVPVLEGAKSKINKEIF